jgi:hypothetical protein
MIARREAIVVPAALLDLVIVVILSPEVTFPSCKSLEPARQDATGRPWSPIVRLIIVVGNDSAISNPTQDPCRAVKYDITEDSTVAR